MHQDFRRNNIGPSFLIKVAVMASKRYPLGSWRYVDHLTSFEHPKNETFVVVNSVFERNKIEKCFSIINSISPSFDEMVPLKEVGSQEMFDFFTFHFPNEKVFFFWVCLNSSLKLFQLLLDETYFGSYAYDVKFNVEGIYKSKKKNFGSACIIFKFIFNFLFNFLLIFFYFY